MSEFLVADWLISQVKVEQKKKCMGACLNLSVVQTSASLKMDLILPEELCNGDSTLSDKDGGERQIQSQTSEQMDTSVKLN